MKTIEVGDIVKISQELPFKAGGSANCATTLNGQYGVVVRFIEGACDPAGCPYGLARVRMAGAAQGHRTVRHVVINPRNLRATNRAVFTAVGT